MRTNVNCPFCNSEILKASFSESQNFRAVYNHAPILPGHSLIVPKQHHQSILELNDEELSEMMIFSKNTTQLLNKAFKTNSFDWTLQEGMPAGQTVMHLHIHLIPRTDGDLPHPGDWYPLLKKFIQTNIDSEKRPKLSEIEMSKIVSHLKSL